MQEKVQIVWPKEDMVLRMYYALMRKSVVLLGSAELKYGSDCSEIIH